MLMSSIHDTSTTLSKTPITTLLSSNGIDTTTLHPLTLSLLTSTTSTYVLSSTSGLTEPTNSPTSEFIVAE